MNSVKDFNKTYRSMRLIALVSLLGFMVTTAVYVYQYHQIQTYFQNQTYVITGNGTFPASFYDGRKVSHIEVKNHIETFVNHMFAHSAETYYDHINLALELIDTQSGKRIYHDFEQGEVQKNYVRYGSHTSIQIDSVVIDMNAFPIKARFYALQKVHIGSKVRTLPIAAEFNIVQDYRHEQNPFGLLITDFDFIAYQREPENPNTKEK